MGLRAMRVSMIERIAAVLAPAAFDPASDFSSTNAASAERARTRAMKQARRVMAAMREPTVAMIVAGDRGDEAKHFGHKGQPQVIGWRAMLHASRAET
jgi:hypothetical protein